MEAPDFLPLGTVCIVKGSFKKLMIIARGSVVYAEEEPKYYDYGACFYPEGLLGDAVVYFNHEVIQKVLAKGYTDDDEALMLDSLKESVKHVTFEKGDPSPLKAPNA